MSLKVYNLPPSPFPLSPSPRPSSTRTPLLKLLLRPQLIRVPALLLPAVGRPRRQPRVALAADHLVAVVLASESFQAGFDDAAAQAEDEVEGGFLFPDGR